MDIAARIHLWLASLGDVMPILLPIGIGLALLIPPFLLVQAFLVSLGLQTFFVDIGTTVTAPRILGAAALLSFLLMAPHALGAAWRSYPGREYLMLFLLFLGGSIILNLPFFPEKDVSTTLAPVNDLLFRGRVGRGALQWIVIALRAATPLLLVAAIRSRFAFHRLLRLVLIVSTAVCLYGLYQVAAYYQDLPAVYIYRGFHDPTGRNLGQFQITSSETQSASRIFRISSLVGEPRELAAFLIPITTFLGVLLLNANRSATPRHPYRQLTLTTLFLLHAAVFLGTFSTNGWMAGGLSVIAVWWFLRGTRAFTRIIAVLGLSIMAGGILLSFSPHARSILDTRLLQRLSVTTIEDPTYGIPQLAHMIRTWPHTLFVGASPGGSLLYEDYLNSEIGFVHYFTDLGIIGTGVLTLFLVKAFRDIASRRAAAETSDPYALALASAVLAGMVSLVSFAAPEVVYSLWVFLGFAAAYRATQGERSARA